MTKVETEKEGVIIVKYKNKYRIESHRMPNWDYSGNGIYFLTIVTQNRVCNLGNIVKMYDHWYTKLSDFGKIVETEFLKSFEIRDELLLDEYIIMPNHLHCIVIIKKNNFGDKTDYDWNGSHVEMHGRASLRSTEQLSSGVQQPIKQNYPIPKPKSISSFFAGFKSAVNSKIDDYIDEHKLDMPKYNRKNHFFQSNYYDHIIRNNAEYICIKNYIINNPKNWGKDKINQNNFNNSNSNSGTTQ